jgi:hypothetical protein
MIRLLLMLAVFWAAPAEATVIYDWTGTCGGGCAGQAALSVIVGDGYVPGTLADFYNPGTLERALYTDNRVTYDLALRWGTLGMSFRFPAADEGGQINMETLVFGSDANGVWSFGAEGLLPDCDPDLVPFCGYMVHGTGGVWTRNQPLAALSLVLFDPVSVPLPTPLLLVLLGAGVLTLGRSLR